VRGGEGRGGGGRGGEGKGTSPSAHTTFFEIFAFLRPTATFEKTFAKVWPGPRNSGSSLPLFARTLASVVYCYQVLSPRVHVLHRSR